MAVTKKIQIQNASGTGYDSRNIGAEAEYVDVSRDSNGDIITDLDTQTVDSTESLAQTLKNLEDDTAIDSALSTTSTKAVQNKVITGELNKKIPTYTTTPTSWDTTPTQNSTKPITSGGVYDALQGVGANDNFIGTVAEWEALTDTQKAQYKTVDFTDDFNGATIDAVPTEDSTNAVSSGGVYSEIQTLESEIQTVSNQVSNSDDAYSSSKAYKVGDLVIHDDVLYKCITACSAAAWSVNQSCFVADTLTNALNSVNTQLTWVDITNECGYNGGLTYINKKVFYNNGKLIISLDIAPTNMANGAVILTLPNSYQFLEDPYVNGICDNGAGLPVVTNGYCVNPAGAPYSTTSLVLSKTNPTSDYVTFTLSIRVNKS